MSWNSSHPPAIILTKFSLGPYSLSVTSLAAVSPHSLILSYTVVSVQKCCIQWSCFHCFWILHVFPCFLPIAKKTCMFLLTGDSEIDLGHECGSEWCLTPPPVNNVSSSLTLLLE